MDRKAQTQAISILIFLVLMFFFANAINKATTESLTADTGDFEVEPATMPANTTESDIIKYRMGGLMMEYWLDAPNVSAASWNFGDGRGNEGVYGVHEYPNTTGNASIYLVTVHVEYDNGSSSLEYRLVKAGVGAVAQINLPDKTYITIFSSSLFITGAISLFLAVLNRWVEVPPQAYTVRLRVIYGVGAIAAALLSIGWFNTLIGVG